MIALVVTGTRGGSIPPRYGISPELIQAAWKELREELEIRQDCPDLLIVGDARGIDAAAREWATRSGFPAATFQAHWGTLGRSAGSKRNKAMIVSAMAHHQAGWRVFVLAFPSPESRGTWHCVRCAQDAGLPVRVHKLTPQEEPHE